MDFSVLTEAGEELCTCGAIKAYFARTEEGMERDGHRCFYILG